MRSAVRVALALLCVMRAAPRAPFESEDVVPVRMNHRTSGRFWKRSEERPSFPLCAFDKELSLSLIPDTGFIAPYFTGQRVLRGAPGARPAADLRTEEGEGRLRGCFYSGTVDDDQSSVVGNEYFIEPKLRGVPGPDSAEQLHVVRRRTFARSLGVPLPAPRRRRFISAPRFIETLVVVDSTMAHFYGDEVKHYILTLMSMAAQLYKHPSIKNSVSVVLVKMLVVEDEEVGPELSSNGGVALRNFCSWQQLFNPTSQRHPEHYDTAVLFTREV
uniref:Peptidase M12B propeptide domain-containing protein n=1 Tax=Gasterosteus aculeatus aculeatus TaxID=481459 RepID=A0AAQ4RS92_GASAC